MTGRTRRPIGLAAVVLLTVACSDAPDTSITTTITTTFSTTTSTSSTTTATTSPSTTSTTTTLMTTTLMTTTTTVPPYPTTTVHTLPADCDVEGMLATVEAVIVEARLAPTGTWNVGGTSAFDDRTNDAEEFRDRLALDCRLRAAQADGDRLVLAAWTGDRYAFVVQSADAPASPYAPDQRLQLLIEQPYGEWLVDQEVWAGTLDGGETVIVAVDDSSLGATAKAWQALPRWEDLPITIDTERYAIDVLLHAGARNVSPGEEPAFGSTIAAIQFVTPGGLPLIATVAPLGDFDPTAPIVEGERAVLDVDGVDLLVTTGAEDSYAVGSVGWTCGDHVWFVDSVWGTVDELVDWAATLIAAGRCSTDR